MRDLLFAAILMALAAGFSGCSFRATSAPDGNGIILSPYW